MKKLLERLLPEFFINSYHYIIALAGAVRYGFPSRKMTVIGVTGTKGKTSTANFIWSVLQAGEHKTGIISTANIRIGENERMNEYHMTMPGRWHIQRLMAEMVRAECQYCVFETTSEGIKQCRHIGVRYDICVFTNLSPEHLPSHGGSFENYKTTKAKMFAHHPKLIIANRDDEHADYFLSFPADKKIAFTKKDFNFGLSIPGDFNKYNAMPAVIIGRYIGMSEANIAKGLANLTLIPGRMEKIDEGQDFIVYIDYAHEKKSITYVLQAGREMAGDHNVIILLGAEGGGRDKAKRAHMGELAGKMADYLICSNVDPYEDDPTPIVEDIAVVAEKFGKVRGKDLFVIEDRRKGIRKAFSLARIGDVVLITGKGAEQSMIIGGKSIPWDDRVVVREELKKL